MKKMIFEETHEHYNAIIEGKSYVYWILLGI